MTRHDRIVGLTTIIIIVSGLFFVTDRMTQGNNSSALSKVEIEGSVETTPAGIRYSEGIEPIMSIPLLNAPIVAVESTEVPVPRTDDR